jgi:metal-responsive CopG/Arc/MetJ family transcriptional regulator
MVRINAVLREEIVDGIDEIAKETGESRSSLLREAAQRLIKEYRHQKAEEMRRKKTTRAIQVQDRLRKKAGKWNAVAELRKWREMLS